ncbi:hypothetical protein ABEB36_005431 [Hypothenemus hampei]|uniref:Uncharacterized protein n=1 Tax=Hypothenemus hampei TaxID=57062 RepID=A0ABD1EYK5_HYPHA
MCTTATASALLSTVLIGGTIFSIMCGNQMATEGLPLSRRVRGAEDYEDILAGNEFLSVFLESTLHRLRKETTTAQEDTLDTITTEPYMRETRQANYFESQELPSSTENQVSPNNNDSSNSVVIAVHVSSSVDSQINKFNSLSGRNVNSAPEIVEQNVITSEDRPALVANNEKSELNVEEPSTITKNHNEGGNSESTVGLNTLPTNLQFRPRSFSNSQSNHVPTPFHHSLIYHDSPSQPGQPRSVSYSTIIQDIQPSTQDQSALDRKERNYETVPDYRNSYDMDNKPKTPGATSTSTTPSPWPKSEPSSTIRSSLNVYGRPEQNYEVDEAVSVVTNGRTHGVQRQQPTKISSQQKNDKDQKVGYVVEGRNYRKYRVEERTPDGFIVGEYGVVSHDDGSLRGVRYTADGTINPRLIYDALMKFLAL